MTCFSAEASAPETVRVWDLDSLSGIGGNSTVVLGTPKVVTLDGDKYTTFDGEKDGVMVMHNPIGGWSEFTIEVLFSPSLDGQPEQRFLHIQDDAGSRSLMEIRLTPDGKWCLDTFLLSGEKRLTLIDRAKLHPAGQWYWAALVYDGAKMSHFVNAVQEMEGPVAFAPMGAGRASLGMRLNRVFFFKGAIREVRFHAKALPPEALQKKPA